MSATAHQAPAWAHQVREQSYRGGLIVFLVSESMFFLSLISVRFLLAGTGHPAAVSGLAGALLTVVMAASLLPAAALGRAARRGDWHAVIRNAALTGVAGLVLLAGTAAEWAGMRLPGSTGYGGVYYLTAGLHALHILIAVILLAGVAGKARAGRFTAASHFTVQAAQLFWYLVAGLWLLVWAVFYLA